MKEVFFGAFSDKEEAKEVITQASEALLDISNLKKSLSDIERLYVPAKFDYAAGLGFLQISVKEIEQLRAFVVVTGAQDYATLHKSIKDYDSMQKVFFLLLQAALGVQYEEYLPKRLFISNPRPDPDLVRPDI